MKFYKGQKQFNVNVFYNSSWCLFSADDSVEENKKLQDGSDVDEDMGVSRIGDKQKYMPYKFSGKNFSF